MRETHLTHTLQKWMGTVNRTLSLFASFALFLMMMLTAADVVMRKIYGQSILGTVELTEFLLVIIVFFSLAQTEFLNGHIKLDLIKQHFDHRTLRLIELSVSFLCFLLFLLFTASTLIYARHMMESGEVSQELWLPLYPFVYLVGFGCAVLSFTLFIKLLVLSTKIE